MRVCGIDYSMTSPALCLFEGKRWSLGNCKFHFLTKRKTLHQTFKYKTTVHITGHEYPREYFSKTHRFDLISQWAFDIIKDFKPEIVALEGYSMGSRYGRSFDIAENTGLLKYKLFCSKIKWFDYPPTTIKQFATGKGNANKQKMADHFKEETQININDVLDLKTQKPVNPVQDIIDSYFITKLIHEEKDQLI